MSNFLKTTSGIPRGAGAQGTDIGSGSATATQFLAANGTTGSAFRSLVSGDIPSLSAIYLPLTGGIMSGTINMGANQITNAADPTTAQALATKNYVDTVASGLEPLQSVYAGTVGSNLVGTYVNGVAGVGATFTITATGAFTIDGTTPPVNSRILIKDQTSGFQNGVYNLTVAGTIGISPIFTRSSDYNTASDMNSGAIIPIINGTINSPSGNPTFWLQTATIVTVGTDSLTFVKFNQGGSGTVTSVALTVPSFLSVSGSPVTGSGTLAVTLSGTPLPNANTTATSSPTANTILSRDSNSNSQINSIVQNVATTATAAGTTTLTVSSSYTQQFTGTTTQTVVLPNATTLIAGQAFLITNRSTGVVTVNANGGGLIQTMAAGSQTVVTVITVGTSAGTWDSAYSSTSGGSSSLTSLGIFAGKATISSAAITKAVTFSTAYANTNYAVTATMLNVTDTNPQYIPVTITAQATTGFTASWNAPTPTANYVLSWTAIANN